MKSRYVTSSALHLSTPVLLSQNSPSYMIQSVFVLSKAGGLIFHKDYTQGQRNLRDSNDYLVIAGTFHSVHALSTRISPTNTSSGIHVVELEDSLLHCFQTLTGVKFLILSDKKHTFIKPVTAKLYELYADYVMKNPFYTLDMPIKCSKFDRKLKEFVSVYV